MSTSETTTSVSRSAEKLVKNGKNSANDLVDAAINAGGDVSAIAKVEFDNIMSDLQDLIQRAGKLSGQELASVRQQMSEKLGVAKEKLQDIGDSASSAAHNGVANTEQLIKEHPLQAIGIAALAGLAIGALLSRR